MAVTTLAIVGAATAAASAGMSFAQAAKQNQLKSEADMAALESMSSAEKELQKNYYKGLAIQKEPYELQREAALSAGTQLTEAAKESERGAAAAAGRIYDQQQKAQADIRSQMGKEMSELEKLSATEDARLAGQRAYLNLQEAEGAQEAAAAAEKARAAAITGGFSALQTGLQQGIQNLPLYFDKGSGGDGKLANPNKIGTVGISPIAKTTAEQNAYTNNVLFGSPMATPLYMQPINNPVAGYNFFNPTFGYGDQYMNFVNKQRTQ